MSADIAHPKEPGIFALFRKHVNDNLGLIIAFLSALFAGVSGWEAYRTRLDALASLKIAQRSYIDVQEHTVSFANAWQASGERVLQYNHMVTVYGNSPAFQVFETSICRLGLWANPHQLTLDDLQFRQSFKLPLPFSQRLPAEIVPGSKHTSGVGCYFQAPKTKSPGVNQSDMGVLVYGVINYEDIFGDKHQKHFCYYNISLEPEAVDNYELGVDKIRHKWPEDEIEAGKHLIACDIFNDDVSGEAITKVSLAEAPNQVYPSPAPSQAPAPK